MRNISIDWKRYWFASGEKEIFNLYIESGLLRLPSSDDAFGFYPKPLCIEEISDRQCVILTGEAGIGKSDTLRYAQERADEWFTQKGNSALFVNLRLVNNRSDVRYKIIDSQLFQTWLNCNNKLYIFLDSLDECRKGFTTIASCIFDELSVYKHLSNRLFVRIATRPQAWEETKEIIDKYAVDLWGNNCLDILKLAPLTEDDIKLAALRHGYDPEHFIKTLIDRDALPLAGTPLDLSMLLSKYEENHTLPSNRWDLFHKSSLDRCKETNPGYRERNQTGCLDPNGRLHLSSYIAALMTFCDRSSVWSSESEQAPQNALLIEEIIQIPQGIIPIDQLNSDQVKETLDTALFTPNESYRIFRHQSYCDFLAAYFIHGLNLSLDQKVNLFFVETSDDVKVIPSLREPAAWLATQEPALLDFILINDPETLLFSDNTVQISASSIIFTASGIRLDG